mgnify:CR=1 FL=1
MRILIADDDPQILRALRITLAARGYEVLLARDGAEALSVAVDRRPDLYLLDLGMPRLDGIKVIEAIRGWSQAPILVVSGRSGSNDIVAALDAGADDYVTKPFAIDELLARIRALGRRVPQPEDPGLVVGFGDVTVDLTAHSVLRDGRPVRLTPTEWKIVDVLVRNADRLVSQQTLLHEVWGPSYSRETNYLRVYMAQLRRKLEPDPSHPRYFVTEPGMGYRFIP